MHEEATGRVQTCEIRDNSRAGAGWDLQVLEAGELLFSHRCNTEDHARLLAGYAADDMRRCGWITESRGEAQ
jgi:hypothetical protein